VGEESLLFTADLLDQYGHPLARGVLLDRWSKDLLGDRGYLVPPLSFYYDHDALLYYCALAHLNNNPLALHGHTGVGKTELVRYFAALLGAPVYRMNLHGLSTTDDIIGKLLPAGQGTVIFQDGLVTAAVRHGGILLLEEMNATGQEVWFALHGLLDGSRALVLVEKDNEVVPQHPACRIFSTFNPAEYPNLYPGTKELSAAYLRRWASVRVGFPSPDTERTIVQQFFPEYKAGEHADVLETMLEVARVARKLLNDRSRPFEFVMSTGVLVEWASLCRFIGPVQSARLAFYDIQSETVKAVFRDQIFSYLTEWDSGQLGVT
jgi:MoxR-like ATPase